MFDLNVKHLIPWDKPLNLKSLDVVLVLTGQLQIKKHIKLYFYFGAVNETRERTASASRP